MTLNRLEQRAFSLNVAFAFFCNQRDVDYQESRTRREKYGMFEQNSEKRKESEKRKKKEREKKLSWEFVWLCSSKMNRDATFLGLIESKDEEGEQAYPIVFSNIYVHTDRQLWRAVIRFSGNHRRIRRSMESPLAI